MQKVMHQLVQGLWKCHWIARLKKTEKQKKLQCSSTYTSKDRKVTCLTLKNVRDLDVESHASIVQGLWQCHWIIRLKKTETQKITML